MEYWLRSANNKLYNHEQAFKENEFIDWNQGHNKYEIGDTVFIYATTPFQRIMYETRIEKLNLKVEETIDDKKYFTKKGKNKEVNKDNLYLRLKLTQRFDDDRLSLDCMKKHGLTNAPQGPQRIKSELLEYLESVTKEIKFQKMDIEETNKIEREYIGKDKEAILKVRVGQGLFKQRLLEKDCSCKICGILTKDFLIASHIKPWSKSNEKEKVDINNGFLLCPNHDALFDKGYISFEDTGKIIISNELSKEDIIKLNISCGIKIELSEENKKYLKYHRDNTFKK